MMPGCESCYFKSPQVGNRGDETSPFVIVGESPGIMEVHFKKAFTGPSGKVINEILERCGVHGLSQEPYYVNAIHCLPRKVKDPKVNQDKLVKACLACRPRLMEDINKHPRKVILALGNAALWSLTGDYGLKITQARGKLFESPLAEVGVVACVHPAYLLRGKGNFIQFERDVKYAIDLAKDGNDAMKTPNGSTYRILDTEDLVQKFIDELQVMTEDQVIASDIETTGFKFNADRILVAGFQHKPGLVTLIPAHLLRKEIWETKAKWVWHNGKFDIKFLRHAGYKAATVHEDTMLMSYSLNERTGVHDLDQVASDWLGSPNHKHMVAQYITGKVTEIIDGKPVKRSRNYGDIPWDVLCRYTAFDLSDTYQLYFKMRPVVAADKHSEKLYTKSLIPASEYLAGIEMYGMYVDKDQVNSNATKLLAEIGKLEEEINQIALSVMGVTINVRSSQQMRKLLYGYMELAPISASTDKKTIQLLTKKWPRSPVLKLLAKHRVAQKGYSTYVKAIWKSITSDGKVHTTFKLHATATGRLASADPNVQNTPRNPYLRGQYLPMPGRAILEVDYSQAELRSLAVLSNCSALCAVFEQGLDLHVELSTFLFGKDFTKEDKMKAKTVNFGIVYGREAPSIAEAFGVTVQEAQRWIDGWFERFPGAAAYITKCRNAPQFQQTIITVFGNKKRPGVVAFEKLKDFQNEAANFPHQNIASMLNLHAGIKLQPILRDQYDTHIMNTVHDCIVTDIPFDITKPIESSQYVKNVAAIMKSVMENESKLWGLDRIPFKVEPEFGFRWGSVMKFDEIEKKYGGDFSQVPRFIEAH